jgi:LCP family protein required for cell wall assembly
MSERKGGPEPGSPEYQWLYGKRRQSTDDEPTRVRPRAGAPDESERTRVLPTIKRGTRYAAPEPPTSPVRSTRSTPPPPPPPPTPTGRRFKVPRLRVRWLKYALILWLVYLIAVPFWAWTKVSKVDAWPDGNRPDDQPGTTYLLVGSDAREGLAGQRTDTIMLLHTGSGPNLLMSIPRDSQVEIPGHGTTKINAAFAYGGPKLLIGTIEQNTGIRVDHYVEIGFTGFKDVVDALGGITICPSVNMTDPLAHLNIKKGCQEADGKTALGYSRARHFDPRYGDISRAQHQREVVSAVGKKALSPWTIVNPFRYWDFSFAAAQSIQVSKGTGLTRMAMFASAMTHVNGDSGLTCVVPLANLSVQWDMDRARKVFHDIINDDTADIQNHKKTLCTPKGLLP